MAAVNYASCSTGPRFHMMAHDEYFPLQDQYSSSTTGPPFFDLSDYMILQLDDQLGPSPPPAAGGGGGIIPASRQLPPPPPPPPQGGVLVADLFGSSSSITTTAGGAAAAAGQFNYMTSQHASSSRISNSVEAGGGGGLGFIRVAFRTKTEVDVLDDGFKWRKYGKKSVKNSPNPRNYYRCSTEGCSVKKRVERDRDDPNYVITTYDGVHNHTSADFVYYATQDTASGHFVVSGSYGDTTTPS